MPETMNESITISQSPRQLFDRLTSLGISRFWLAGIQGEFQASHPELQPLRDEIARLADFHDHEAAFFECNQESQAIFSAFVHSTNRGQAQGGVRLLDNNHYGSIQSLVVDGLRLAKGMTEKNALAEIWWGGGKAIICPVVDSVNDFFASETDPATGESVYTSKRARLFENFGTFIASLDGIYITAADMNTIPTDMISILSTCRFVTCLEDKLGGSGSPSTWTAEGTFVSMRAGLVNLGKNTANPFEGVKVLLQGAGHVGEHLLHLLVSAGAEVVVYEVNQDTQQRLSKQYAGQPVELWNDISEKGFESFVEQPADVFSPNAIGAIVTAERIARMQVQLIAGAANNQLQSRELVQVLHDRGIMYLPDFLVNCMGIINCANEQYGYSESKIRTQIGLLEKRVTEILERRSPEQTVYEYAIGRSLEMAQQSHPIWPGNGQELIRSITGSEWANR